MVLVIAIVGLSGDRAPNLTLFHRIGSGSLVRSHFLWEDGQRVDDGHNDMSLLFGHGFPMLFHIMVHLRVTTTVGKFGHFISLIIGFGKDSIFQLQGINGGRIPVSFNVDSLDKVAMPMFPKRFPPDASILG